MDAPPQELYNNCSILWFYFDGDDYCKLLLCCSRTKEAVAEVELAGHRKKSSYLQTDTFLRPFFLQLCLHLRPQSTIISNN
jgi:hypothetical protein